MEYTPSDSGRDVIDRNLWVYSAYQLSPPAMRLTPPAVLKYTLNRYSYFMSSRANPCAGGDGLSLVYALFLGVFFCLEKRGGTTVSVSKAVIHSFYNFLSCGPFVH